MQGRQKETESLLDRVPEFDFLFTASCNLCPCLPFLVSLAFGSQGHKDIAYSTRKQGNTIFRAIRHTGNRHKHAYKHRIHSKAVPEFHFGVPTFHFRVLRYIQWVLKSKKGEEELHSKVVWSPLRIWKCGS